MYWGLAGALEGFALDNGSPGKTHDWLANSARAIALVALFNIFLALVAVVREMLTVRVLGTSAEADAFFLAYFVPDTVANLLIGTALGAACLPVFARKSGSGERPERAVSFLLSGASIAGVAVIAGLWALASPLASLVAPEFSPGTKSLFASLIRITGLSAPLYLVAPVMAAALNAESVFVAPAAGPVVFNLIYTLALGLAIVLRLDARSAATSQSFSVPVAALGMVLVLWAALAARKWRLGWSVKADLTSRQVIRATGLPLLILCLGMVLPVVERYCAARLGEGGVASLNYAYKMAQFPVWVFSAAVGTVAFPAIARSLSGPGSEGPSDGTSEVVRSALGSMLIIACPVAIALVGLRQQITEVLFAFSSAGAPATVALTMGTYGLCIVPQSVVILATRFHLVSGSSRLLIWSAATAATLGATVDVALAPRFGLHWLGVGAIVANVASVAILGPGLFSAAHAGVRDLAAPLLAASPMLLAAPLAGLFQTRLPALPAAAGALLSSVAACLLCGTIVIGLSIRLQIAEVIWIKMRLLKKLGGAI